MTAGTRHRCVRGYRLRLRWLTLLLCALPMLAIAKPGVSASITAASTPNATIPPAGYMAPATHATRVAGFFLNGRDSGQSITLLPLPQGGYAVDLDQFARRIGSLVQEQGPLL
ncbi:MAG: hypothetical protein ACYCUL_08270, partial [Metallibacterium scheffleri]